MVDQGKSLRVSSAEEAFSRVRMRFPADASSSTRTVSIRGAHAGVGARSGQRFHFGECADAGDGAAKIVQSVPERIPRRYGLDPVRDIQVLCPMNRGGLGARSLNIDLQQALNPPGELRIGSAYGIGAKVMQVENDYDREVYNGDVGVVRGIDPDRVRRAAVAYGFAELDGSCLPTRRPSTKARARSIRPSSFRSLPTAVPDAAAGLL